jgi:hypothetical protein
MASMQPTIKEPTTYKKPELVYKSTNPYEILSNNEVKVEDKKETKDNKSEKPCICAKYLMEYGIAETVPWYWKLTYHNYNKLTAVYMIKQKWSS